MSKKEPKFGLVNDKERAENLWATVGIVTIGDLPKDAMRIKVKLEFLKMVVASLDALQCDTVIITAVTNKPIIFGGFKSGIAIAPIIDVEMRVVDEKVEKAKA